MHSSHAFFHTPSIPTIVEQGAGYLSTSSTEEEHTLKPDIPRVLLPSIIAIYPHQTSRDHTQLTDMKQFNGFMANNPNVQEFSRHVQSDVETSTSKLFLSKRMKKCFIHFGQMPVKPYAWMDFALLYNERDLDSLYCYDGVRLQSENMRTELPMLYNFVIYKDELVLKQFDGNFQKLKLIFWGHPQIGDKIRKHLFSFTHISQQLLLNKSDNSCTLPYFIRP